VVPSRLHEQTGSSGTWKVLLIIDEYQLRNIRDVLAFMHFTGYVTSINLVCADLRYSGTLCSTGW
jgi:hypothetical protein